MRFSLDGIILDGSVDIPMSKGLHHHGDEPTLPGYTIQELLYLSRSAVASQRCTAFKSITSIIRECNKESETTLVGIQHEILHFIGQTSTALYFVDGLLSRQDSVLGYAIDGLAVLFQIDDASVWDTHRLCPVSQGLFVGVDDVRRFRARARGTDSVAKRKKKNEEEEEEVTEIETVVAQFQDNIVAGFVRSGGVDMLLDLVSPRGGECRLNAMQIEACMGILVKIVRGRGIFSNGRKLVEVMKRILCVDWPSVMPSGNAIKLAIVYCQVSRENAKFIGDSGLVDVCMRYLAFSVVSNEQVEFIRGVQCDTLVLLSTLFQYRHCKWIVEDYQPLFIDMLLKGARSGDQFTLLLRMITTMCLKFQNISSLEFTLKAYASQLLEILDESCIDLALVAASMDLITLYASSYSLVESFSNLVYSNRLFGRDFHQSIIAKDAARELLEKKSPRKGVYRLPSFLEPYTVGLSSRKAAKDQCLDMIRDSHRYHLFASYIRLCISFAKSGRDDTTVAATHWKVVVRNVFVDGVFSLVLKNGMDVGAAGFVYGVERGDWTRHFMLGWSRFLVAWITAIGGCTPFQSGMDMQLARLVYRASLAALSDTLPGDECFAYTILHTCLLGRSWMKPCLGIDQDAEPNGAWGFLKDYYDLNLWTYKTLAQSRALHSIDFGDEEVTLESLMLSKVDGAPVSASWMFSPLQIIIDENMASGPDVEPPTDVSDAQLISIILEVVLQTETRIEGGYYTDGRMVARMPMLLQNNVEQNEAVAIAGKLYTLMSLYMLGPEVYLDTRASAVVTQLLDVYLGKELADASPALARQFAYMLEQAAGGQIQFFNVYRQLVAQVCIYYPNSLVFRDLFWRRQLFETIGRSVDARLRTRLSKPLLHRVDGSTPPLWPA
jgi:hypothetical protein